MTHFPEKLLSNLPAFLNELETKVVQSTNYSTAEYDLFRTYLGEIKVGLETILEHLKPNMRILEVGSGMGALGQYLTENGFDIHGIEPGGSGFDAMSMFSRDIQLSFNSVKKFPKTIKGCEDLHPSTDGVFDLIFSIHVMEHVPDIEAAINSMASVLKPEGKMVHLCPNYRFPYDPHFSIPILFWSPVITETAFQKKIRTAPGVWKSLNFVTAKQLQKLGNSSNFQSKFKQGVMADFVERLQTDTVFAERHNGLASKIASLISRTPLMSLLRRLPAAWLSPMIITMSRK